MDMTKQEMQEIVKVKRTLVKVQKALLHKEERKADKVRRMERDIKRKRAMG